jgi:hypothetical protein
VRPNPQVKTAFQFEVKVEETASRQFLFGDIALGIQNTGDGAAPLSSIIVRLEEKVGSSWQTVGIALQNASAACGETALTQDSSSAVPVLVSMDPNKVGSLRLTDSNMAQTSVKDVTIPGKSSVDLDMTYLVEVPWSYDTPLANQHRITVDVTFANAGQLSANASVRADHDCDPNTPDEWIRTVSERGDINSTLTQLGWGHRFVDLADVGLEYGTCIEVSDLAISPASSSFSSVDASFAERLRAGGPGSLTSASWTISGNVNCDPNLTQSCQTNVVNKATLEPVWGFSLDVGLIEGSPAIASFEVSCDGGSSNLPCKPKAGDLCTQTQGGWGSRPCGNNPGAFLRAKFASVWPNGLVLGDANGFTASFSSAAAIRDFLPTGGRPGQLDRSVVDPQCKTKAGVLLGQLLAAKLNVGFDAAGLRRDGKTTAWTGKLGELVFKSGCVARELVGKSVNEVIAMADLAVGRGQLPSGVSFSELNDALTKVNENFVDCRSNGGCLISAASSCQSSCQNSCKKPCRSWKTKSWGSRWKAAKKMASSKKSSSKKRASKKFAEAKAKVIRWLKSRSRKWRR